MVARSSKKSAGSFILSGRPRCGIYASSILLLIISTTCLSTRTTAVRNAVGNMRYSNTGRSRSKKTRSLQTSKRSVDDDNKLPIQLRHTEQDNTRLVPYDKAKVPVTKLKEGYFVRWMYETPHTACRNFSCLVSAPQGSTQGEQTCYYGQKKDPVKNSKIDKSTGELMLKNMTLGCDGYYKYKFTPFAFDVEGDSGSYHITVVPLPVAGAVVSNWSVAIQALFLCGSILALLLCFFLLWIWYVKKRGSKRKKKQFTKADISGPTPNAAQAADDDRGDPDGKHRDSSVNSHQKLMPINMSHARNDESIHVTCEMVNNGNTSSSNNNDDVPLLTPTLKDSAISSTRTGNLIVTDGVLLSKEPPPMYDENSSMVANMDGFHGVMMSEKTRQLIEQSNQQQDRTSRLLAQVDNFVSDRESSSIAMGTSATSNPPSLVNQHNQSPASQGLPIGVTANTHAMYQDPFSQLGDSGHGQFYSPADDESMRRFIDNDVEESLRKANTLSKPFGLSSPASSNLPPHKNNSSSRHSSNTTTSRQLPSYEEVISKRNRVTTEKIQNIQYGSAPQYPTYGSYHSSTLPRNLHSTKRGSTNPQQPSQAAHSLVGTTLSANTRNYTSGVRPQDHDYTAKSATLQRTSSANKPGAKMSLSLGPAGSTATVKPASDRQQVEASNMDYC